MYKLTRNKVGETSHYKAEDSNDWGIYSIIFRMITEDHMEVLETHRPTIGYQVRLDNRHTFIQTSPVVEIISDEPEKVVFETKSGSKYTWEIEGEVKVIEYPDSKENNKNKEDAKDFVRRTKIRKGHEA